MAGSLKEGQGWHKESLVNGGRYITLNSAHVSTLLMLETLDVRNI